MDKAKSFLKSKRSFRRFLPLIGSRDRIDYKNLSLITRFISGQGKILYRRVNRSTLKQQQLRTTSIKQARILFLLSFIKYKKKFDKNNPIPRKNRTRGPKTKKKKGQFLN